MALSRQSVGLYLGPSVLIAGLLTGPPAGLESNEWAVALVAILMATWWISEALPLAATALVPIVLFPALDVLAPGDVTRAYGNHLIYLFLGGFLIAVTMQRWNLHRRIALHTINLVGTDPRRMILGFMLATAVLSMWISNTATAMMMLPIAMAVLQQSREEADRAGETLSGGFGVALMLGIAYSASIGGVGTLIGTPPNAVLAGMANELYGIEISFAAWMAFGVPLSAIMLAMTWVYLAFGRHGRDLARLPGGRDLVRRELEEIGSIGVAERRVLIVFVSVALAWVFRGFLPEGTLNQINDSSIAIAGALALFLLSAGDGSGERLLDWKTAVTIPWDIVLLFGGGFALAAGFTESGLSETMATGLEGLAGIPVLLMIAACVALVVFLTEVTSNTATATLFVPLMGALAVAIGFHPLALMAAVAVAASCAFMLPVATPPNAVVFGSRAVTVPQMARAGLLLNLVTIVLTTAFIYWVLPAVMGISLQG
ncbi:SLC13 family permease [Aquisalimonas asiatica]|uniref:Solute carrier family 13 (Sodium-dependent dicarboxylate transporter), member 2/3/5 n=1 Tax=Aquisalimonas asiatica TaxID=406100 RepID=A0A1H8SLI2_9GAMM|nr:SLC13 family permease [Aquisalimonas asiatica]SEO79386.1 solute carrier family 13 (sodium-dependent dicarboxylate transporter), member 2/3/5 [Aquisalimonas asiatica]